MRLPRTLAVRAFLLIGALILLSLAAAAEIFLRTEREPRARQLGQMVVAVVNLTRAGLLSADPALRPALLAEMAGAEDIRVLPVDPGEALEPLSEHRPEARWLTDEVRRGLGERTRFAAARNHVEAFWVSFFVADDEFWVMLPRERVERAGALRWAGWGALVAALALAGAWLIARQVGWPLKRLAAAARRIGRGEMQASVPESGAEEVATVARAFNRMAEDLARVERERAFVLAGISHDLRTPLSRLRLGVEMLGGADERMRAEMVRDLESMDGIVGQFLAYARGDGGEAPQPAADLNAVIAEAVREAGGEAAGIVARPGPVPPLQLRPVAVRRLAANLIQNARCHGAPPVEVETGVEGEWAWLRVLDRGPGIPPEAAERLMQPFQRLDPSRQGEGTGLGLAIVERIARLHGGHARIAPRDGGGLAAEVRFPLNSKEKFRDSRGL